MSSFARLLNPMAITPGILTLILFAAGALLLVGELFLPTQGILGTFGVLSIVGGIAVGFWMNQWLGLGLMLATLAAAPFAITIALNVWPKTPIGKRMILPPVTTHGEQLPVGNGEIGVAVTALRPGGECEFGPHRIEASSELGPIAKGQRVQIVRVEPTRAIVRPIT
jgi:membrane-bound ClpP family serine protease